MMFEWIAMFAAGLFAGASLYINLVEHPARVECGTAAAVAEFGPSYRRAAVMQASLAVIGTLSGIAAWPSRGSVEWLAGAVLLGAVVPFTLLVILPTNKKLLDPALDPSSRTAADLLSRWQRLHGVRTVLGSAAFGLFAWLALRPR